MSAPPPGRAAPRPRSLRWWALSALFLLAFALLAARVAQRVPFPWDVPVMLFIHAHSRPWLDAVVLVITDTGGGFTAVGFLALLYWLHRRGERRWMGAAAVAFLGAVSLNPLLKQVFARPRPEAFPHMMAVHTYSFPSGHTVAATALYGFLALTLWRVGKKPWALLAALWVLLVAFSRVYLGVHYPSDVLGGLAFGSAWLLAVWGGGVRWAERRPVVPANREIS